MEDSSFANVCANRQVAWAPRREYAVAPLSRKTLCRLAASPCQGATQPDAW
jgi:hypothetical protein